MTDKKKQKEEKVQEQPVERIVETVDENDTRNYTVVLETTYREEDGQEYTQTVNVFANTPADAFAWMVNVRQLYDQKGIVRVKLIGVYRRTTLTVVEGDK